MRGEPTHAHLLQRAGLRPAAGDRGRGEQIRSSRGRVEVRLPDRRFGIPGHPSTLLLTISIHQRRPVYLLDRTAPDAAAADHESQSSAAAAKSRGTRAGSPPALRRASDCPKWWVRLRWASMLTRTSASSAWCVVARNSPSFMSPALDAIRPRSRSLVASMRCSRNRARPGRLGPSGIGCGAREQGRARPRPASAVAGLRGRGDAVGCQLGGERTAYA